MKYFVRQADIGQGLDWQILTEYNPDYDAIVACFWTHNHAKLFIAALRKSTWDNLMSDDIYEFGCEWPYVTNEMRREAWSRLPNEDLYRAGAFWKGITDDMRREAWARLIGKDIDSGGLGDIYMAGLNWRGITDEMRREAWAKLSHTERYHAGFMWKGITANMKREGNGHFGRIVR